MLKTTQPTSGGAVTVDSSCCANCVEPPRGGPIFGHNLAKNITCNVNPLFYVNSVNDSIVVQYVSVAQVRNAITSLMDSNPGWDHLSPFLMKQCVDTYVEPITILINNSFYHGIFPDELKLERVVLIFKSGDSSKINNYRPISILPFFFNNI